LTYSAQQESTFSGIFSKLKLAGSLDADVNAVLQESKLSGNAAGGFRSTLSSERAGISGTAVFDSSGAGSAAGDGATGATGAACLGWHAKPPAIVAKPAIRAADSNADSFVDSSINSPMDKVALF